MTDEPAQDSSLPRFLAHRARNSSDGRLALDAAAGLLTASGAAVAQPWGWVMLAAAGGCFAAFGFWGIADRELLERKPGVGAVAAALLVSARFLAAALGVVAALVLIYGTLAVTLGTWIS